MNRPIYHGIAKHMQTCFKERRETTLMSLDKQQANASTSWKDLYLISFMAEPYAVAVIPFINLPSDIILHMGIQMKLYPLGTKFNSYTPLLRA